MLQRVVTFGDARFWSCPRTAFACVGGSGAPEAILGRLGKPVAILGCVCCYIAALGGGDTPGNDALYSSIWRRLGDTVGGSGGA